MATLLEAMQDNNRRFSIVVQGGGMRGVYSAGALACLDHYELQKNIVSVTGSSAGALNAAYFIAEQPGMVNTYTSLLSNKEFINLARSRKKVDVDYMIDIALHQKFPIDIVALKSSPVELDIVLTEARTGAKKVVSKHSAFTQIYEEFRATSALPVLYDKKVMVANEFYIDGGVSDLLPVDVAIDHKPTDILVIMTRPLSFYTRRSPFRPSIKRLLKKAAKYQSAAVREMLPTNEAMLKKNITSIKNGTTHGVQIHLIAPKRELKIGIASIDSARLESAAEQGWKAAEDLLNSEYREIALDKPATSQVFDDVKPERLEKVRYIDDAPKKLKKYR